MQRVQGYPDTSRHMMWKFILPPVVAITLIWVAASSATTFYIQWMEKTHQQILDENVTSVQSADQLQQVIRRFQRIWSLDRNTQTVASLLSTTLLEVQESVAALKRTAITSTEQRTMNQIDALIQQIEMAVRNQEESAVPAVPPPKSVLRMTDDVIEHAQVLKEINQRMIDDGISRRSRARVLITMYRSVLLILGPLIGVWMGWRLAQRLQRWAGHLSVTLQQTDSPEIELGTVLIPTDGILSDLQNQAETIVGRLKTAQIELNQSRAEVLRSERLAAVGQLAAGVAHEFRNPLTSVKLLLQHASRRGGISTLKEDQLELVLGEISRMESTIGGLLDFSRQQPLRFAIHDFRDTVQRALNLIQARARHQNIDVRLESPQEPVVTCGDVELLHQVIVNICINAIESMPDGGELTITIIEQPTAPTIAVTVRDTGPGINPEVLLKLFEPFVTTKDRGTGLGLAISRRIVTLHRGTLTASNASGGPGAVFTVEFPKNLDAIEHTEEK